MPPWTPPCTGMIGARLRPEPPLGLCLETSDRGSGTAIPIHFILISAHYSMYISFHLGLIFHISSIFCVRNVLPPLFGFPLYLVSTIWYHRFLFQLPSLLFSHFLSTISLFPFMLSNHSPSLRPFLSAYSSLRGRALDHVPYSPPLICVSILMCIWLTAGISYGTTVLSPATPVVVQQQGFSALKSKKKRFSFHTGAEFNTLWTSLFLLLHPYWGQNSKLYRCMLIYPFHLFVWCFALQNSHVLDHCTLVITISVWRPGCFWYGCLQVLHQAMLFFFQANLHAT